MAVGMNTYVGSSEMRQSLLSILKDISPTEDNYFVSNLAKGPNAVNTLQEWNTFYEARPTSVTALPEGAATVYADLTSETRTSNYTAIVGRPVRVSRTMQSVATVTGEDEVGKQKMRSLKLLKADMEYLTINGAGASAGLSGVARGMAGIDRCISTLVTGMTSGQSFTETILNDMIQDSWTQVGSEYVADMIVAPAVIKRRIASFGTNLSRNIEAAGKRLTKEVRVYDSELGPTVMIIAHKDVRADAGTLTVYALKDSNFAHSFLVGSGEPHWEERAKDGDYVSGTYLAEFSLISYGQRASVRRTGFSGDL